MLLHVYLEVFKNIVLVLVTFLRNIKSPVNAYEFFPQAKNIHIGTNQCHIINSIGEKNGKL